MTKRKDSSQLKKNIQKNVESKETSEHETTAPAPVEETKNIVARMETLNVKINLTDEELLDISREMSEHLNRRKQAEDDLASFSSMKKADIKNHDAVINRSAGLIQAGYEYKNVKCVVEINQDTNTARWKRIDNDEVVLIESPIPSRLMQTEIQLQ